MTWGPVAVAAVALLLGTRVRAQTSCPTPDALCTGDPCVTTGRLIEGTCDLDFGNRALVLDGGLILPGGGRLTLRARSIAVPSPINGRGTDGATITLIATGSFEQRGLVDASGTRTAGAITIQAGGDVLLNGKMRAISTTSTGGSITVDAGGRIIGPATISHDVHGGRGASAGTAIYRGAAGVNLIGHLIMRSGSGGYAEFSSLAGPVSIGTDIRTRVSTGAGATIVLNAATDATVARGISADGRTAGGTIVVTGATVTLPPHQGLHARGRSGPGGTVFVFGGTVRADETIMADGSTAGGTVAVQGERVAITRGLRANGRSAGGHVSVLAAGGDLAVEPSVEAVGGGGTIELRAVGNLVARGALRAGPDGCIVLGANGVIDVSGAILDPPTCR